MITETQRDLRKKHLGSSDAPAVLGLSRWASPVDVWLEKTAEVEPAPTNAAMEIGNRLEPVIIDFALERLADKFTSARRNVRRVAKNGIMAANLDCQVSVNTQSIPLEVKFASDASEWGAEEDGIEGVPVGYLAQVLHQMVCLDATTGYLAVFLPGYRLPEFRLYEIVPERNVLDALEAKEIAFWNNYVVPKVKPPSDEPADLDVLKRVKREPGKSIVVADALVNEFLNKREAAAAAQSDADRAKAELITALGDAEAATWGGGTLTYKEQVTRRIDTTALTLTEPKVAERFRVESNYRVLRVKESK